MLSLSIQFKDERSDRRRQRTLERKRGMVRWGEGEKETEEERERETRRVQKRAWSGV